MANFEVVTCTKGSKELRECLMKERLLFQGRKVVIVSLPVPGVSKTARGRARRKVAARKR